MDLREFAQALDRTASEVEDGAAIRAAQEFANPLLDKFRENTPVETGALRDSEYVSQLEGDGSHATVAVSTSLALYASFRNDGGTIRVKNAKVLTNHVDFFGKEVTQVGSQYKERTVEWAAAGPADDAARNAVIDILHESGL